MKQAGLPMKERMALAREARNARRRESYQRKPGQARPQAWADPPREPPTEISAIAVPWVTKSRLMAGK